jgi:hypothetical protein
MLPWLNINVMEAPSNKQGAATQCSTISLHVQVTQGYHRMRWSSPLCLIVMLVSDIMAKPAQTNSQATNKSKFYTDMVAAILTTGIVQCKPRQVKQSPFKLLNIEVRASACTGPLPLHLSKILLFLVTRLSYIWSPAMKSRHVGLPHVSRSHYVLTTMKLCV